MAGWDREIVDSDRPRGVSSRIEESGGVSSGGVWRDWRAWRKCSWEWSVERRAEGDSGAGREESLRRCVSV